MRHQHAVSTRIDAIVFLLVLAGPTVTLCAREDGFLTPPGVFRTLSFPADRWMGNLFLEPKSGPGWDPEGVRLLGPWDHLSAARGEVQVPEGRNVKLDTLLALNPREAASLRRQNPRAYEKLITDRTREDPSDLSGLLQLGPDDLYWLWVGSAMYRKTGADPQIFAPIGHLTGLEILTLNNTGVTGAGLEHLRPLRALKGLELTQFPISSRALAVLKDLPALEYLSLNTNVTDAGLKQVAQVPSLRWLSIIDGKMWGPGLAELARLPRLERLCIQQSRSQLSDRNIRHLEGLTQLKSLTFWSSGFDTLTDASLASISKLENLEELYLIRACPKFTLAGLAHLKRLKNLRKVNFGHTWLRPIGAQCGDDIARLLVTMPQLESIERIAYLSEEGMKALATLPNLKCLHVSLRGGKLGYQGPSGLPHLTGLRSLEKLIIESHNPLPDADLASLEALSGLRELSIHFAGVSDRGLASIGKLRQLERLDLDTWTLDGLNHLNGLSNLEYLKVSGAWENGPRRTSAGETGLDLSGLQRIKDLNLVELPLREGDLAFLKDLPHLRNLTIGSTSPLPGSVLRHLEGLPELDRLYVRRLSDCTGEDLTSLNGLPKLRGLTLSGEITESALASLTGPPSLGSVRIDTDNPIREETVDDLTASHPVLEYVRIHALTPTPTPADVPQRTRPDRQTRTARRRGR